MKWPLLLFLGGLVGLDATSGPQLMFSRPIVAATLAGLALGRPAEGLLVGALLEAFAVIVLPVGAARYPESGTAAVAAAAAYALAAGPGLEPAARLVAVAFGLVWERVTGATVTVTRRLNERLVADAGAPAAALAPAQPGAPAAAAAPVVAGSPVPGALARAVERRHLTAMAVDFARGAVVTAVGAALGSLVIGALAPHWSGGATSATGLLAVAATAMIAAVLPLFGGWRERRLAFALGVLCGVLMSILR